ncbi:MAG: PAS domain-containing protein [Proteobacteria bacterium]|nr:PAS domain-containing protein [Pseudomonadota bacterium]
MAAQVHLDWRQVEKWGIPRTRVPPDAVLHFRTPTFWEAYKTQALKAVFIGLAQGVLILALLVERRRRQKTASDLVDAQQRMAMAAKAARLSAFVWELGEGERKGLSPAVASGGELPPGSAQQFNDVLSAVHPNDRDRLRVAAQHALQANAELDVEYRVSDGDGQLTWVASRGQVAEGGRQITGVCMDVSDRKKAELQASQDREALAHTSRVATLGQLSAAIAHQLHQPLASIMLNAQAARKMLDRADHSLEEIKEILRDVIDDDARAADTIRNLQALYRQDPAGESSIFDLNDLMLDTLRLLRSELIDRGVETRLDLAPVVLDTRGNRTQIQQVMLNLIVNAMDAMADAGTGRRVLAIRSSISPEQGLRLEVIDQGTGIADLNRIFEPFWTTKSQGVGVGLSICRAIVHAHGGTLVASNNPGGRGATFALVLPRAH